MISNIYKYKPLQKIKDTFFVKDSTDFDYPWADESFVETFEKQLLRNFEKITGNVVIDGAEFKGCQLFKPKEAIEDDYYIKVSINNIPVELEKTQTKIEDDEIDQEGLEKLKLELIRSEYYYHDKYISLDNNYLYPRLKTSDQKIIRYLDEQIFLIYPKLLIIGPAGSGKTTLVRKLAYELLSRITNDDEKNHIVPLYFKLRDFNKTQEQFDNALIAQCNLLNKDYIDFQKNKGKVLLIFDGIDELNQEDKLDFFSWIDDYLTAEKTIRVLITSRDSSDLNYPIFKNFQKLFLQSLHISQIHELSKRILGSSNAANNFYGLIKNNVDLIEILSNPLSLSLSLALYFYKKILPTNIATLISQITNFFTETWDEKRSIQRYELLNSRSSKHILGKLAYSLKVDDKFTFKTEYCQKIFPSQISTKKIDLILTEIKDITGLITHDKDYWSFSHKYFQDFFCANFLIEKSESTEDDFLKFKNESKWLNVWNNAIELSSDPEFYFKLQKINQASSFYNLSRLVTALITIDEISFIDDIDFANYFLETSKRFDKLIENINVKNKVSIKFNQKIKANISELGYLIVQIYLLNKSKKLNINQLIKKNSELAFFKFLNRILKFKNVPKYVLDDGEIIFSDNDDIS